MINYFWILVDCLGKHDWAVMHQANTASLSTADKSYYNNYGYYFPQKHIVLKGSLIKCLGIMPKHLKDSNTYEIKRWIDEPYGKVARINASQFKLDQRHFYFAFKTKTNGDIAINGRFARKVGPFDDPGVGAKR